MDRLAIVVPCYNEEEVLEISSEALRGVIDDLVSKNKVAPDSFVPDKLPLPPPSSKEKRLL